jgi:uncharacterized membrane protein
MRVDDRPAVSLVPSILWGVLIAVALFVYGMKLAFESHDGILYWCLLNLPSSVLGFGISMMSNSTAVNLVAYTVTLAGQVLIFGSIAHLIRRRRARQRARQVSDNAS